MRIMTFRTGSSPDLRMCFIFKNQLPVMTIEAQGLAFPDKQFFIIAVMNFLLSL